MQRRSILKAAALALASAAWSKSLLAHANRSEAFASEPGSSAQAGDIEIFNAGIGGNNTVDLLARVDQDCLSHKPTLTILMVGTNDMNSVKYVPLADYEKNLNLLIKKIGGTGSKILMMSILPMFEPYLLTRHPAAFYQPEGVQARRKAVNLVVEKVAAKHKLYYLDLGHRFEAIGQIGLDQASLIQNEKNTNKTDGIHPTANGYRFIALSVYDYIVDHKLPLSTVVCFGDSITKGDGSMYKDSYPAYLKKLLS